MSNNNNFIEKLREDEGYAQKEASEDAPDYSSSEFDETEGQRFVEEARQEAQTKALPTTQKNAWQRVKDWASTAWRFVFEAPYFQMPEPTWEEKLEDPLGYTNKEPERLMELAGIDPDAEPFSGFGSPDPEDENLTLPDPQDQSFQRSAHDVIRERAEAGDIGFYKNTIAEDPGDVTEFGFYVFLGNGLMNETAESSGWVEDRTGRTLQDIVRSVAEEYTNEYDGLTEQLHKSFQAAGEDGADPFDLQSYGDVEGFVSVFSEALSQVRGEGVSESGDPWDMEAGKELDSTFQEVVRALGQTYQESLSESIGD